MARLVSKRANQTERTKVSIADYAVASDGSLTTSGLGSCLGIVIYDSNERISSLLHPMLPHRNGDSSRLPERFVDSGIDRTIRSIVDAGADESTLRAKITGGAAVIDFGGDDESIGDRNVRAAHETLSTHGIPIVGEEVGGDRGRTVHVEAETGVVTVKRTDGVNTTL